jgi:SAM-dependent methyltransferase
MQTRATTAFAFDPAYAEAPAGDVEAALARSLHILFRDELGWSEEEARLRTEVELQRSIPRALLNFLERSGWHFPGAIVADIGCGHGGLVLELLDRGAQPIGLEPSLELSSLAGRRLLAAGFSDESIVTGDGASLPFPDQSLDYAISLQVLEHVSDPDKVISEVFRVLRPGGQFFLSCENYLAFREQHYRIFWLPLMPKSIGKIYLTLRDRKPAFLMNHVFYCTCISIRRAARTAGFVDIGLENILKRLDDRQAIRRKSIRRSLAVASAVLNPRTVLRCAGVWLRARGTFRVGVQLLLQKPDPNLGLCGRERH